MRSRPCEGGGGPRPPDGEEDPTCPTQGTVTWRVDQVAQTTIRTQIMLAARTADLSAV
jgi:hypothetical protein